MGYNKENKTSESERRHKMNTKGEVENMIVNAYKDNVRKTYIKHMVQGYEVAMQTIYDYLKSHTKKDTLEFCKRCLERKNLDKMEGLK